MNEVATQDDRVPLAAPQAKLHLTPTSEDTQPR